MSMKTAAIAAIIVNWNKHDLTAKCIDSLKQSQVQCHIIVVDNGSSSSDLAELERISGINLVRSDENLGFGRGNNLGIRWALLNTDCEQVFLLNNDATVMPDTLGLLESALSSHSEVGMVSPRIVYTHDPGKLWYGGGEISWIKGGAVTPGFRGPAEGNLAMTGRYVTFASGCAMLIRRTVLETVGGFDPRFFLYEEDLELCLRVIKSGYGIRYIPNALVLHIDHGSLLDNENGTPQTMFEPDNPMLSFYMFHRTKNKLIIFNSHAKGLRLFQFWACFPMYWGYKCTKLVIHGKWNIVVSVIKGFFAFINSLNSAFKDELKD